MKPVRRILALGVGAGLLLLPPGPGVSARGAALAWSDCGEGFQCATARVPLDYSRPGGRKIKLALVRLPAQDPARRIGSLFVNPGGPGGSGIDLVRGAGKSDLAPLNARFDLVGWDPRGVGQSAGAVDCAVDQERRGIYAEPFARPGRSAERRLLRRVRRYVRGCVDRNSRSGLLPHLHTANTARDLNRLRAAVGDRKVSYLGYSYGTQIGATYATLFPRRVRALVLDGAVDVEGFVDHPIRDSRRQAQAFEQALGRFFGACRARQDQCGLGASPRAAYRTLARRLDRAPLPVFGPPASSVDGDDLRAATLLGLNQKQLWPALEGALVEARTGDGSLLRTFADVFFEREGPSVLDPYVAIYALDGRWPARPAPHLRDGRSAYRRFDHFWWAAGYSTLALGLWPVQPQGAHYGPVRNSRGAPTTLVVGTTHDPATPYVWAKRLTADLGNARLLTMRGDGHTASFGNNSPCIDAAVQAYLEDGKLPAPKTSCSQDVPSAAQRLRSARAVRHTLEKVRAGLDPRAGLLRSR